MSNVVVLTILICKAGTFIHFANCSLSISVSNIYNKRLYAFQYCQCLPATICADFKLMTTGTNVKTFNNPSLRMRASTISCFSCKCGHYICRAQHIYVTKQYSNGMYRCYGCPRYSTLSENISTLKCSRLSYSWSACHICLSLDG